MTNTVESPTYVVCANCGNRNRAGQPRCFNCQQLLPGASAAAVIRGTPAAGPTRPVPAGVESGATMRVIGWIVLAVGLIAGMMIIKEYGRIEGPFGTSVDNPVGTWMGIGVIAQSFLWAMLSFALAAAAENSAEMRTELWDMRQELRSALGQAHT